jgi:RHS repeat-associated protein
VAGHPERYDHHPIYGGDLEEVSATGPTATDYAYAGTMRLAVSVNGTVSFLASDALGSAIVALNTAGNPTASVLYAPYGAGRYSQGTMPTDYGFTGQHSDAATGLDYYDARYYDPLAGQFTSADTVLPGAGYDPWGLSRYAYVAGNPVGYTDPDGHWMDWALVWANEAAMRAMAWAEEMAQLAMASALAQARQAMAEANAAQVWGEQELWQERSWAGGATIGGSIGIGGGVGIGGTGATTSWGGDAAGWLGETWASMWGWAGDALGGLGEFVGADLLGPAGAFIWFFATPTSLGNADVSY